MLSSVASARARPSAARSGRKPDPQPRLRPQRGHEDRKKGEAAARADGLRIVAHVARVEQGESEGQGTTGHAEIDQRLRTHASRHSVDCPPPSAPIERPEWYRAAAGPDLSYTDSDSETVTIRCSDDLTSRERREVMRRSATGRASDGWQRSRSRGLRSERSRQRGSSLPVGSAAIGTKTPSRIATPWPISRRRRDSRRARFATTSPGPAARGSWPRRRRDLWPDPFAPAQGHRAAQKENTPLEQIRQRLQDMRDADCRHARSRDGAS